MAWGKVFKVSIGDPSNPFKAEFNATTLPDLGPLSLTEADNATDDGAIDLSNLTVGFSITRSNVFSDNRAELNIANISQDTANRFIGAESSFITIEAGYEDDGTALIFSGYITSVVGQWHGADHYLNIVARTVRAKGYADKDNEGLSLEVVLGREKRKVLSKTYMSLSYAPGAKLLDIIKALSSNLGVVLNVFNEEEVSLFIRPNGYNYVGRMSGLINDMRDFLISEGYDLNVSLSEMNIYKLYDTGSVLDIPAISYDTGLLKVGPVQNYEVDQHQIEAFPPKSMWEIETILIPRLEPNRIVQIESDQLSGYFLVESVEFHGDNTEGDYNCTTIVSKQ